MYGNEYEDIYDRKDVLGFLFCRHEDGKLSKPYPLNESRVKLYGASNGNSDSIFVLCTPCEELMRFQAGPTDILDGKWVCPICKRSVREKTPYSILERINTDFESAFLNGDFDF